RRLERLHPRRRRDYVQRGASSRRQHTHMVQILRKAHGWMTLNRGYKFALLALVATVGAFPTVGLSQTRIDLTRDVRGVLPKANSGTGSTGFTASRCLHTDSSGNMTVASIDCITNAITDVTLGNLTPLFSSTHSVGGGVVTLGHSLNAAAAWSVFGNNTNASATPAYFDLNALI